MFIEGPPFQAVFLSCRLFFCKKKSGGKSRRAHETKLNPLN